MAGPGPPQNAAAAAAKAALAGIQSAAAAPGGQPTLGPYPGPGAPTGAGAYPRSGAYPGGPGAAAADHPYQGNPLQRAPLIVEDRALAPTAGAKRAYESLGYSVEDLHSGQAHFHTACRIVKFARFFILNRPSHAPSHCHDLTGVSYEVKPHRLSHSSAAALQASSFIMGMTLSLQTQCRMP